MGKKTNGDLVHAAILKEVPKCKRNRCILFNELMNMIDGDLAMTREIAQHVKRSAVEIWRKFHKQNDPTTYGSKENLKRPIENIH